MSRRAERLALAAIVAVAAVLRLARPGADLPLRVEPTGAALQDAFWYLEAAAGPAEGLPRDLEPVAGYDPPVWVHAARAWFTLAGASLGTAQALGGLVSLATLLLAWRWCRAAFDPGTALVAAAVLAVADPFAGLGRTTLVYGPGALALTCAACLAWAGGRPPPRERGALEAAAWLALALAAYAALELAWPGHALVGPPVMARAAAGACLVALLERWLVLRARRPELAWRLLLSTAAWAVVLAAGAALRPPVLALAGGLALLHLVRARRPALVALALAAGAAIFVATVMTFDPGGVGTATRERLGRYLSQDAGASALALRLLRLGGEAQPGSGTGLVALAPGAWLAAALGALALALRWPALPPGRRDAAALVVGWAGAWLLGALLMSHAARLHALRYAAVLAVPLAALAGLGVAAQLAPPAPAARARAAWLAAACGALVAPHVHELLAGPRGLADLALAALAGAALAAALARLAGRAWPAPRRGLAAALALGAVLPGLALGALDLTTRAATSTRDANRAAGLALGRRASLVGPHASLLALGHGLERRRAPWIDVSPAGADRTIAELRRVGATHIALGLEQELSSGLQRALRERGVETTLVGIFLPRGTPVLLLRLPWWRDLRYELSPFEAGEDGPTGDRVLLLTRARTLAVLGRPEQARAMGLSHVRAEAIEDNEIEAAVRQGLLIRERLRR